MHSSYFKSWTSERTRDDGCNWSYVVVAAFLLASAPLLVSARTYLHYGAGPHESWLWPFLLLAAALLLVPAAAPGLAPRHFERFLPLVLAAVPFVPLELQVSAVMLAAVGVLAWIPSPALRRVAGVATATAGAWLACVVVYHAYGYAEARTSDFSVLAAATAPVMAMLGHEVHAEGSFIYVVDHAVTNGILASPDKFGGAFVPCFIAGLLTLSFLLRTGLRRAGFAILIVLAYMLLRTSWLLTEALGAPALRWWDEMLILRSYAPLAVLLLILLRMRPRSSPEGEAALEHAPGQPLRLAAAALAGFLIVLGWHWVDPGQLKDGAIMIDERYSRWEWSEDPLDTKRFGVKTTYSYYNMMEEFGRYYDIERNFDDITDETLEDVSVLILKTPTEPYSDEALDAIWRFVDRGGGIWLIGDHTNVFGMSTYLNMVGEPYGIHNEYDSVLDPETNRQISDFHASAHPIVRRMPPFIWMTGNTVRAPWGERDVILTPRLLMDKADFSTNSSFGDFRANLHEKVGWVVQAVAHPHGRGRVAIWSDSTVFSNFAIFMPGKMELAHGYVDWLNRKNSAVPWRWLMLGAGVLALAPTLVRGHGRTALALWSGGILAYAALPPVYERSYPPLEPHTCVGHVAFLELNETTAHLPIYHAIQEATPEGYLSAFIAAQRIGKRPYVARSLEDIEGAESVVIIHGGHRRWSAVEIGRLLDYVDAGGQLILLDAGRGGAELVAAIGEVAGFSLDSYEFELSERRERMLSRIEQIQSRLSRSSAPRGPALIDPEGRSLRAEEVHLVVQGELEPIFALSDEPDKLVVGRARLGRGSILVSTTQHFFSDASVGEQSAIPDPRQYALLQSLFDWYAPAGLATSQEQSDEAMVTTRR